MTLSKHWFPRYSPLRTKRVICIPPLTRAWWRQAFPGYISLGLVVLAVFAASAYPSWEIIPVAATVVTALGVLAVTIPFARMMPIWDLLYWENKWKAPRAAPGQRVNLPVVNRAARTLWDGHPERVREALAGMAEPDLWFSFVARFLQAEADLAQGQQPEVVSLREDLSLLGQETPSATVMVATLEAGSEWLAGRDWRQPLLACRAELRQGFSLLGGLWPVWRLVILLPALATIPWAWWLWGH